VVRPAAVRQANLAALLDSLRRHGPQSRSALGAATGLTRSAISGLVGELVERGLATQDAALSDGRPGRPSPQVRIDDRHYATLAIEAGVDDLSAAIVALDGTVVRSHRIARPRDRVPVSETLTDVADLVRRLGCAGTDVDGRRLVGVGVAVPGVIRAPGGVVVSAPNLGWTEVDLAPALRSRLRLDLPVSVGNDADLGALAESRFGAGRGATTMVYVAGEVGVGGGLVVEGRRIDGHRGFAGEVGHMPVDPDGAPCSCGSFGCFETVVGERALLERAGLDPDGGSRQVARLLAAAEAGDAAAIASLALEGRWLGIGLTTLINAFDPEIVVLGALLGRVLPFAREALDDELERRRFRRIERSVPVVAAALGIESTLVGAGELAFASLLDDPASVALDSG
jgi:predicted NBD/HSP70 family sugar kinase